MLSVRARFEVMRGRMSPAEGWTWERGEEEAREALRRLSVESFECIRPSRAWPEFARCYTYTWVGSQQFMGGGFGWYMLYMPRVARMPLTGLQGTCPMRSWRAGEGSEACHCLSGRRACRRVDCDQGVQKRGKRGRDRRPRQTGRWAWKVAACSVHKHVQKGP